MAKNFPDTGRAGCRGMGVAEMLQVESAINQKLEELNDLMNKRKNIASKMQPRSAILSMMSHDLRTPLNSILGFSELLLEGMNGILTESQADFVKNIHESALELFESIKTSIEMHDK